MTGEITLRGKVLPVGGIREKILAAHRANIKKILIPERNVKDLPGNCPRRPAPDLEIIPVTHMDQVIEHALHVEATKPIKITRRHKKQEEIED